MVQVENLNHVGVTSRYLHSPEASEGKVSVFTLFLGKEAVNRSTTSGKPTLSRNFDRF
jgi:hypothetical protein